MSGKKSYMNKENILSEGFFDKLINKISGRDKSLKSKLIKSLKKDKNLQKSLSNANASVNSLEKYLSKLAGKRVSLQNYELGDFIK